MSGAAGKLVAPPAPDERRASSSASGDTGLGALIAAGRDLPNRASESSQHCDYRNRAASDVDSASEKGASSIEGHLPLQLDVHRRSQPYIDSSRQRAFSGACSLEDEQQGTESRHASSQHGSGSSIYGTPQPSLSSLSQASAATCAPDKRESNPLYACSSSGASSGIRGAQANPYYACSTSSASSGSALPQRQPFWPHAAQAALATSSMLSFTAQSIPEDAASEVQRLCPPAAKSCPVSSLPVGYITAVRILSQEITFSCVHIARCVLRCKVVQVHVTDMTSSAQTGC